MKPMKFEFVVFGISNENAVFLWNIIVKVLQSLGFDVTGNVSEVTKIDFVEEVKDKYWYDFSPEEYKKILDDISSDDEDLLGGVDWSAPASYYSNEDEHDLDTNQDEL